MVGMWAIDVFVQTCTVAPFKLSDLLQNANYFTHDMPQIQTGPVS